MNKVQRDVISLASFSLFGEVKGIGDCKDNVGVDYTDSLFEEALAQMVLPLVISACPKDKVPSHIAEINDTILASNMNVLFEHHELHTMMNNAKVNYVSLKGACSGYYYPNPTLRTYGDVDFFIDSADFDLAGKVLNDNGFILEKDTGNKHASYTREPSSEWEMHRYVYDDTPDNVSKQLEKAFSDIIEQSAECDLGFGTFMKPSTLHHGLILLTHTASHLTHEGIGLRHLCDWACFINKESDFIKDNRELLHSCGLFQFANTLTALCVKYLGLNISVETQVDDELLSSLIDDIMQGGNFGHKDADRYSQIKYISNREDGKIDSKNSLSQAWNTLAAKAKREGKSRMQCIKEYLSLVALGKRKLDGINTIKQASKRKELYSKLGIFEVDDAS